jgi:hypothetical protein
MQMETFTQASGRTIKHMALESIITLMVQDMKGSGFKTNNTGMEKSFGLTVAATKGNINKERSKVKANLSGLMGLCMMEISKTT